MQVEGKFWCFLVCFWNGITVSVYLNSGPTCFPSPVQNMYKDVVAKYSAMKGQGITGLLPLAAFLFMVCESGRHPDGLFTAIKTDAK